MTDKIIVQGNEITIISKERKDYISLTDIARYKNKEEPFSVINNWMRGRYRVPGFMGKIEQS
jgi:hypothetical protein